MTKLSRRSVFDAYVAARAYVIELGYGCEIDYQSNLTIEDIEETEFLRETAWVILNSGMRESVVRLKFDSISNAFMNFDSAQAIASQNAECIRSAQQHFNHVGKLRAIAQVANHVNAQGFEQVMGRVRTEGTTYLSQFSFIGPATSFHLGKNLGLTVAKPDRHLERIAARTGYPCVQSLCGHISEMTGDRANVVDTVLWRFASSNNSYLELFGSTEDDKPDSVCPVSERNW